VLSGDYLPFALAAPSIIHFHDGADAEIKFAKCLALVQASRKSSNNRGGS
jgi:hypothetical protein